MRVRWQTKRLIDVCQFVNGLWKGEKPPFVNVGVIRNTNFTKDGTIDDSAIAYLDVELKKFQKRRLTYGDLILEKSGGGPKQPVGRVVLFDKREGEFSFSNFTSAIRVNDSKTLDFRFLHKFLLWTHLSGVTETMQSHSTGIRNLDGDAYKDIQIPLPPLSEQRRIVGILDEAFDSIATAQANVEKNIQKTRVLFESHLQSVFNKQGEGWVIRKVSEIAQHSLGKMLDKTKNKGELQPYLRNINVRWLGFDLSDILEMRFLPDEKAKYTAVKGDVLVCEGGYPGRAAVWNEDYPIYFQKALHRVRFHSPDHNKWFVYFLIAQNASGELRRYFTGTGIQHFTGERLGRFEVPVAPLPHLRRYVVQFDELAAGTQRLESIYQQKLSALDELRKSLFHKAFVGELTGQSRRSVVSPFPARISNITTTDLHAGILAIAFQLHEQRGKLRHYGHVKAEKIAHMVEAHLGIDLGRTPVKDAAGPNDYPHLMGVEHRARKAGFFDFQRVTGARYRVRKGLHFDKLIKRTRESLGDRNWDIESLLKLMLPMDTSQAEIFCTVYAAWNNLLLDGQQPTDESIVFEARENWHPDKLNIPREKFFAAICWLREKDIIPSGKGKMVTAKAQQQ